MKKLLALFFVLLMALSLFAGCGGNKNELVMATNAAFPPYEYKEGNKIVGIDAEIAEAIAKKLGMTLVIEDVEFGAVLTGVAQGKYDMGMAGITVTEDRKKTMDFSNTYATGIQVIIVKDGSSIKSLDDIFEFNADGDPVGLKNPDIKVVAIEPDTSAVLSGKPAGTHGLQGIGAGFIPTILDTQVIDEIFPVSTEQAYGACRTFARKEGILVGITSGAALYTASELAKRPENAGKTIVALLPDSGDRYMSLPLFTD